jgi:succinylarginine dihydrolase
MNAIEINVDGLVGPTHHYAGQAAGNLASLAHKGEPSNPRAAALEGLAKMRRLASLGVPQAVLPPQERPYVPILRRFGFSGTDAQVLAAAWHTDPALVISASSASAMWAANAATYSPASDCADGLPHFTPANLATHPHRAIEAQPTAALLRRLFPPGPFCHHPPLDHTHDLFDEGAANHMRLAPTHGRPGLELFAYGRTHAEPHRIGGHPARQTLGAAAAVARSHRLAPARVFFLRQHPEAIAAGVFHNDVIAVANQYCLLVHEQAWVAQAHALHRLRELYAPLGGPRPLVVLEVPAARLSLAEAVRTYLFNSQLVTLPNHRMALIAPRECEAHPGVQAILADFLGDPECPIAAVHYVDVRQSMSNGGGPACLRLRVVVEPAQRAAIHPGIV